MGTCGADLHTAADAANGKVARHRSVPCISQQMQSPFRWAAIARMATMECLSEDGRYVGRFAFRCLQRGECKQIVGGSVAQGSNCFRVWGSAQDAWGTGSREVLYPDGTIAFQRWRTAAPAGICAGGRRTTGVPTAPPQADGMPLSSAQWSHWRNAQHSRGDGCLWDVLGSTDHAYYASAEQVPALVVACTHGL